MPGKVTCPLYENGSGWNELLPENPVGFNKPTATSFDVIVIGAGFTGLAAARRLAELNSDAKILIIDASRIGEGSSGRNSGTH